jgi:hypothetical protein
MSTTRAISALLVLSLIANGYLYFRWQEKASEVPYWAHHQPLIDKAITLFAADRPLPTDAHTAMQNRFPIAMMVPDTRHPGQLLICVELKARRGIFAITPIYCFDGKGTFVSSTKV